MATVQPFRGWRYNPQKVKNIASVLAPPYDVINEAQWADYCARSPYNIVRLTLGQPSLVSDAYLSRYPQVADDLNHWRDEGILIQEEAPAVYVYEQDYEAPLEGQTKRRGYIAAVKLHDYDEKVILPHEQIRPVVKTERLSLMRACQCTFSQIFGLFSDPSRTDANLIASALPPVPLFEVTDDDGVVHRMWCITSPETLAAISAALADKQIIIADGHHRYQAALAYRDEMRDEHGLLSPAPWEHTTMLLCNVDAGALTILPSHRLIRELPVASFKYLEDLGGGIFTVSERALTKEPTQRRTVLRAMIEEMREVGKNSHIFGIYTGENKISLLTAPRGAPEVGNFMPDRSAAWRNLDLAVLHHIMIDKLLGLSGRYAESQNNIFFTKSAAEALRTVDSGESALAILINPPQVEDVMAIATSDDQMPQKGTYFYPKPLAGVVMYDLRP